MTIGEYRVGISFNPSQDARVDLIKRAGAHLIDQLEAVKPTPDSDPALGGVLHAEQIRLIDHAQQLVEDAAMNGVKAVTKRPHE